MKLRALLTAALLAIAPAAARAEDDVSTPDKAFESFTAFWKEANASDGFWRDLAKESEKASDDCLSEALRAKREQQRETQRKMAEQTRIVWGDFHVEKKVPGEKTTFYTLWVDCTVRTPTFKGDDSYSESSVKEPFTFDFEKHGDKWLLRELKRACPSCGGLGSCGRCRGSGTVNYQRCLACNGNRTCSQCAGKIMVKDTLTHATLVRLGALFLAPDEGYQPSTDRSTAKGAAKAFMDSWLAREAISGKKAVAWVDEKLKRFCAMLEPTHAEAARLVWKNECEEARKRWKAIQHEIESVTEKDDLACAKTKTVVNGITERVSLLLKKEGEDPKWVVAEVLSRQCVYCAGKGVCAGCNGTKKMGEYDCFTCKGKGGCDNCKGFGLVSGD